MATVDGMIGTLVGNGNSLAGAKWTPQFALPGSATVTGLAFAENRFVVTTSAGQIFQSEAIPTLLIEQDSPNSLLITTTADSLQVDSAQTLTNPVWKPAGTITPTAPLQVPIGPATQLFFRAVPQ